MATGAATNGRPKARPHLRARPLRYRGIGGRRQVDPHRTAAVRHEVDLRGPARARGGDLQAAWRRLREPRAAHRRPARRARAGDHDRRGLPLLPHAAAQVHHRGHARPRAVHAQHGHGRVDRRPRADPGGRSQGRARAVAPARLHRVAAAHPAPGGVREQDGPRGLRRGGLRADPRRLHRLGGEARHPRHDVHPDLGAPRRQRGRALRSDGLVRRAVAALPPRARARGLGPQPSGRALPGSVGHAADDRRAARLPRLRRRGGLGRVPDRRRGRGAAVREELAHRRHRHLRRRARRGLSAAVRDAAARGRHRRLARRHDLPAAEPPGRGQGHRRDGLLDGRAPAVSFEPLPDQAHEPHGARQGGRGDLPDRRELAAPRGAGRGPSAERDRKAAPAALIAAVRGRVPPQPHDRQLHPHRRVDERHRRCRDGSLHGCHRARPGPPWHLAVSRLPSWTSPS